MSKKIKVEIHEMPVRITIDMDHETYETFTESCRLLDGTSKPEDHIRDMIQNQIDSYRRAVVSAHATVHAQIEMEGDRG